MQAHAHISEYVFIERSVKNRRDHIAECKKFFDDQILKECFILVDITTGSRSDNATSVRCRKYFYRGNIEIRVLCSSITIVISTPTIQRDPNCNQIMGEENTSYKNTK